MLFACIFVIVLVSILTAPRHSRPVNSLSWSTQEPQLLSAGFDRVRTDPSVMVWDVTRVSQLPSYSSEQKSSSR